MKTRKVVSLNCTNVNRISIRRRVPPLRPEKASVVTDTLRLCGEVSLKHDAQRFLLLRNSSEGRCAEVFRGNSSRCVQFEQVRFSSRCDFGAEIIVLTKPNVLCGCCAHRPIALTREHSHHGEIMMRPRPLWRGVVSTLDKARTSLVGRTKMVHESLLALAAIIQS